MCIWVWAHTCTCVHMNGCQPLTFCFFFFLSHGLPVNLELAGWLYWVVDDLQGLTCLCPCAGVTVHTTIPCFHRGFWQCEFGSWCLFREHFTKWWWLLNNSNIRYAVSPLSAPLSVMWLAFSKPTQMNKEEPWSLCSIRTRGRLIIGMCSCLFLLDCPFCFLGRFLSNPCTWKDLRNNRYC